MKDFARLFTRLDHTNKTNDKIAALTDYFDNAADKDKLWAIALLSGKRPKRQVTTTLLREWAAEEADVPYWLFEDSYHVVGDLAETISLVLPHEQGIDEQPLSYWIDYQQNLADEDDEGKKQQILYAWRHLTDTQRFLFNKLITGGFRVGVSQKLMVKALAKHTGVDENALALRLMGSWTPDKTTFQELVYSEHAHEDISRPYPFFLAYPLEGDPRELGEPAEWHAERKWDGIRGQLIVRQGALFVWSRGEELLTHRFPEYEVLTDKLPDGTVIDGEILPYKDGQPLSFNALQTRIGRKNVTKKVLQEAPVVFMSYDLLEDHGEDVRSQTLEWRRQRLEAIIDHYGTGEVLLLSPALDASSWEELEQERENARKHHAEGIMLKHNRSIYKVGRKRGDWWKWKVDPLTIDAIMIYAMRGHGKRANLYTDYTFAVWQGDQLVPFTKAYSGLNDAEIKQVDRFVRQHTTDRYGPVRAVEPEQVFEIAFEGIRKSNRHKSGVALRFPRINRWRTDKPKEEANTLDDLHQMLAVYEEGQ
jgi:DNA ligase-1